MVQGVKQLTTYLPDDVYSTMAALTGEGESVNSYVRAAVEAENIRRTFTGMDEAIAAVVSPDETAAWHAANAAIVEALSDAAEG
jgi:hypothetical protein